MINAANCKTAGNDGDGGTLFFRNGNYSVLAFSVGDINAAGLIGPNDSLDSITTIILDRNRSEVNASVNF